MKEKAAPTLWEYKNEIGTGGGKDPSIQVGCGYAKYRSQEVCFSLSHFDYWLNVNSLCLIFFLYTGIENSR